MNATDGNFEAHRLINRDWFRLSYYIREWNEKRSASVADMPPFYKRAGEVSMWLHCNVEDWMFRYGVEHNHFHVFLSNSDDVSLLLLFDPALRLDGLANWSAQRRGRFAPEKLIKNLLRAESGWAK